MTLAKDVDNLRAALRTLADELVRASHLEAAVRWLNDRLTR